VLDASHSERRGKIWLESLDIVQGVHVLSYESLTRSRLSTALTLGFSHMTKVTKRESGLDRHF
jgi:hypothetical protein